MSDIRFLCPPELIGRIPEPVRAGKATPDWFRSLPREMGMPDAHGLPGLTVRACLPVADALSLGWIIPLPVDLHLWSDPATGQTHVSVPEDAPLQPLGIHHPGQIGADAPGPFSGRMPLKFINPWRVVLPPGWSALFVHPLNHAQLPFRAFAGAVDCDALDVPVNIPFLMTGTDSELRLSAGTPMVQVIPYRRAAQKMTAEIRAETPEEAETRATALGRKYSEESVYAREWRRRHERGGDG
ncbi:MAG: DUF6065 family protein [Litorimonas sp.]